MTLAVTAIVGSGCRANEYRAQLTTGDEVLFVRAIKGNDLVVRKGHELARVRLVGVYAADPLVTEKNDIIRWARASVDEVGHQLRGQPLRVELIRRELDPRGRHLAYLQRDATDVGRWLAAEGHGVVYTEYPFERELAYLAVEAEARARGRGLWSGPAAVKRVRALRDTWAAVRAREEGVRISDPLLEMESQ